MTGRRPDWRVIIASPRLTGRLVDRSSRRRLDRPVIPSEKRREREEREKRGFLGKWMDPRAGISLSGRGSTDGQMSSVVVTMREKGRSLVPGST